MTYEDRYANALFALRLKEEGAKWFEGKREREASASALYKKNQAGGKLGGRNKHRNAKRKKPANPHPTTILVNRLLLKGFGNKEISEEAGIMPKTVNAIIRRNELPDKDLENENGNNSRG